MSNDKVEATFHGETVDELRAALEVAIFEATDHSHPDLKGLRGCLFDTIWLAVAPRMAELRDLPPRRGGTIEDASQRVDHDVVALRVGPMSNDKMAATFHGTNEERAHQVTVDEAGVHTCDICGATGDSPPVLPCPAPADPDEQDTHQ